MHTVPTPDDDDRDDGPDPVGVAVAAQRYLERTGMSAPLTPANEQAVYAAARQLIKAFAQADGPAPDGPQRGDGWISGPSYGGPR